MSRGGLSNIPAHLRTQRDPKPEPEPVALPEPVPVPSPVPAPDDWTPPVQVADRAEPLSELD